jgi:hypothetical protein
MPPVGFEPTIPASARPQTYALDHAATGIAISGSAIAFSEDPGSRARSLLSVQDSVIARYTVQAAL